MVQFDAASIKQRIIDRLRAKESWSDILFYSTNQRLIDIFAEELAYDMQYDEILTRENKWSLARQVSSLMAETQFFNYYPHRKVGSSGSIKLSTSKTFDQTYPLNISVPKYTTFTTSSGINFCASETTNLLSNQQYTYIPVVQGIAKIATFIAVGDFFETMTLQNDSVENTTFDVYVNNELWTNISSIREASSGEDKVYELKNLFDFSGVTLSFGNDYFGKKLTTGDEVTLYYLETAGLDGVVESTNIITNVQSTLVDTNNNQVDLYCTNDSYVSGGLGYQDIEDVRAKAPKAYQAGDKAISKSDYKSIVESFSFIKKATVWGEAEVNSDLGNIPGTFISSEENVVHVAAITSSNQSISSEQQSTVRESINEKKSPVDIVVFEDINFIYIYFTIAAYVSEKKYSLSTVSNNIQVALEDQYSIDNLDFKKPIRFSDYTSMIDGVEGVEYHDTVISYYQFTTFNTAYTADITLEMNDVTPSSVKVYVKETLSSGNYLQIGEDDGSGNLVGVGAYTLSGSSINYADGSGAFIVSSGLTEDFSLYTIKIEFETDSTNILPTQRYQIVSYGDSSITTSYL